MKSIHLIITFLLHYLLTYSQTLQPTETEALVNVLVTDFSNKPRVEDLVILESVKTKKIYSGITDENGKFSILVPKEDKYNIKYKNLMDSIDYKKQIEIPAFDGLLTQELVLRYEPPKTIILRNINFDFGKATLRSESYPALNDLVEAMKLKKTLVVEIGGHTDDVGRDEDNMKLSEERARSVRNYLLKQGISAERVFAKGYGETRPIADNSTEEGRQMNRRTEVKIISE